MKLELPREEIVAYLCESLQRVKFPISVVENHQGQNAAVLDALEEIKTELGKMHTPWRTRRGMAAHGQCSTSKIDELVRRKLLTKYAGPRYDVNELNKLIREGLFGRTKTRKTAGGRNEK